MSKYISHSYQLNSKFTCKHPCESCPFIYQSNYIPGLSPVCGRPPITDGIDRLTLKRVYEVGEEVTLTCEQGYLPSTATPRRIICNAAGEWTQSDLACTREFTGLLDLHSATF